MIDKIIQGMLGAIIGAVAFVAVRSMVGGLDTSGWGAAEVTMMLTILPLAVSIMAVVVVFVGLQKISG